MASRTFLRQFFYMEIWQTGREAPRKKLSFNKWDVFWCFWALPLSLCVQFLIWYLFLSKKTAYFLFSNVLVSVWVGFFNGFVTNGFYFLRQQCSNDAIVHGLCKNFKIEVNFELFFKDINELYKTNGWQRPPKVWRSPKGRQN